MEELRIAQDKAQRGLEIMGDGVGKSIQFIGAFLQLQSALVEGLLDLLALRNLQLCLLV